MAVFLAEGFEEAEAIVPIDIARRAGIEVTTVSISEEIYVTGSHDIQIKADEVLSAVDISAFDMLMLPGGMPGTVNLEASEELKTALVSAKNDGKYLAAICAAPRILGNLGLLENERATVYPGNESCLKGAKIDMAAKAVTSGRMITSRGMGCAVEFGHDIVAALAGEAKAAEVLKAIQYN
ncbi:MAG: DJ-1/PfpI family protein [Lachnospiraceae bacterium]|nr:DJ-1/PfpI family protein [Lachnospiraceae bacterium]